MSTPPEQTYLARALDDGRYDWARTRTVRRRAAVSEIGLFTALVLITVAAAAGEEGWTTPFFVLWAVGLLAFIPLHSVLNLGIRGVFDRHGRSLDEHQRRLRDRSSTAMGWAATGVHFTAWSGAVAVVAVTGHVVLALCLGFLLWMAAGLLPYWHLAWTAPEEPVDAGL